MELSYFINLVFIFGLNLLFFVLGICLPTVVTLSFWRCMQLRKKLCYFMIMILSCCDLIVVLTNHPYAALTAVLWLTGKLDVYNSWVGFSSWLIIILPSFSLLALLVMNFDRYLATYYPIFHRTSVTKGRLLTLLAILVFVDLTLTVMSVNDFVIPYHVGLLIFFIILFPPMLFINYKLFTISRKCRRNGIHVQVSPKLKKAFSLNNVSCCLLAVACFLVLFIPVIVYIGLRATSKQKDFALNNAQIVGLWAKTIASMNSTLNCLIFYWKSKILRIEGMKIIKGLKVFRIQFDH